MLLWRGHRNDEDGRAAKPAARRESRGSGSGDGFFGASLSALLCAPGDDDDGPSRFGFCDDGADLVDDGPATLERRNDAARPRSVRYTECHTAVLRVETLDARGLESSLRGTARELWRRPYVELQLGSRVVAPSKGGGGSRGGDEDAWMTEDFSIRGALRRAGAQLPGPPQAPARRHRRRPRALQGLLRRQGRRAPRPGPARARRRR